MNDSGSGTRHGGSAGKHKVLILGGTEEARALSAALAPLDGFDVTVSLRGVTNEPQSYAGTIRTGGFGGVEGLREVLAAERFDACIDATHPFALNMSRNARLATDAEAVRLLRLARPAWARLPGDNWTEVATIRDAVEAIGQDDIVFLALGAQGSRAFAAREEVRFVIRTADPVATDVRWSNGHYLTGLPNRDPEKEADLFRAHHVTLIIARNSGGERGYGKIEAARHLGLSVVMITPPEDSVGQSVTSVQDAVSWLKTVIR